MMWEVPSSLVVDRFDRQEGTPREKEKEREKGRAVLFEKL
jgi:hypothetical protein